MFQIIVSAHLEQQQEQQDTEEEVLINIITDL